MAFNDKDDVGAKLSQLRHEAEEREAERNAASLGLPYINVAGTPVELEALKLVSESEALDAGLAAINIKQRDVAVVLADPRNPKTVAALEKLRAKGMNPILYIVSAGSLTEAWKHYKEIVAVAADITSEVDITEALLGEIKGRIKNLNDAAGFFSELFSPKNASPSTSQILASIFTASIVMDASDIHFETSKDSAHLRFRIDGLLHEIATFPPGAYKQILNRVKLLSGLKINISNIPQDGRFTIKLQSEEIEVRVAISPSEFGEAIVMRVLNPKAISLTLSQLGLRKDDEDLANAEIRKPNGMILVTGPTGSGKTTTLYAFLRTVNDPGLKIITIEDPIEYHLPGIEQTQVDSKSGYTFASGLRSMLRQDPDMILVGEIRDLETAEIAIHASLTGHLVFSTLHTNSAVGAVPRLVDVGIKPSVLAGALTMVIAQRLVRKLCLNCRKEAEITPETKVKIDGLIKRLPAKVKLYGDEIKMFAPVGCSLCNGGYKGRTGIREFLKIDSDFESLMNKDVSESAIKKLALEKGLVEMQVDGVLKALAGITTLEEVQEVTGPISW